jgi:sodium/proline symporter
MIVALGFLASVAVFAMIGIAAARKRRPSVEDYLLAGRDVSPWLTALSSAATNNSGFMFIGLLGFTYRFGVQAVWLQAGWIAGDVVAWLWVHPRVRERSARVEAMSVSDLVACDERGSRTRTLAFATSLLTVVFLSGYAGAQLRAGGTALDGLFGWGTSPGVVLGGVIVVAYCLAGGLRASISTDAAQAIVMLFALTALVGFAAAEVGGPLAVRDALAAQDPALVTWIPGDLAFGFALYALGFVFGGLGAIGQPHILVRSMACRSVAAIRRASGIYFLWYVPFSIAAVAAGLYARVLIPDLLAGVEPAGAGVAAEGALAALTDLVLPELLMGVLLAGVFAATMSTADSQLLSSSAAVSQELPARWRSYAIGKLTTLAIAAVAVTIALTAEKSVLALVLGAWSALGASIGPVLVIRLARRPLPPWLGLTMMATGLAIALGWARGPWAGDIFELLPAMLAPLVLYAAAAALGLANPRARVG